MKKLMAAEASSDWPESVNMHPIVPGLHMVEPIFKCSMEMHDTYDMLSFTHQVFKR